MVPRQAGSRRWRLRPSATGVVIGGLVVLVAGLYSTFALFRYYQYNSATYDLVIFDQAVRSYAHFQPGISIVKGLHNGFGPHFSVLGDHFSPIIATLAPLYWIYNGPQDLLIAQSVLFALAIPWVWLFTRRALGGGTRGTVAAYLVSFAYALSWPIASAVGFDFHEVAFAPLLTAIGLERLQAGKVRGGLIALGLLLLVKEDMGLLVGGIGAFLFVSRQYLTRQRLLAVGLMAAGLAAFALATYVIIPAMGGRSDYYWAYNAMGHNVPQVIHYMLHHPMGALRLLVTPRVKLNTMLWLIGAFCFLPLLSPMTLAVIPLLLERMLASSQPNWWGTQFQYNAFLVIILLFAAVDGGVRLGRWIGWLRERLVGRSAARSAARLTAESAEAMSSRSGDGLASAGVGAAAVPSAGAAAAVTPPAAVAPPAAPARGRRGWLAGMSWAGSSPWSRPLRPPSALSSNVALGAAGVLAALAVFLVPKFEFGLALQSDFYHLNTPGVQALNAAVAHVPSGVTVATENMAGPHLASRDTVILWDGDGSTPPLLAPWVVANVSQVQFTFNNIGQELHSVAFLRHNGYKIVFQRDGNLVLHRVGPSAGRGNS
jgi:uncharacterized membrane protein